MTDFEPRPFGKYFLTEHIATGGMAEIYKAKTFGVDGFEKILAIKKILHHYSADQEFITMLTDEAKLVVNLSHANIVQVYDLGRVHEDYFISMEYIDGINLREFIEKIKDLKKEIPPEISLYILSEVCKGLDYAHSKKDSKGHPLQIVHRDVSPQNILVSTDGAVKIVDFGIAKAAMNASQTNIGILKGKVTYMAPEQAFGKPIDGRSDLFSCGIILYELLTQERLFIGESQMEILKKIRNTRISAETLHSKIPPAIRPILAKTLAYSVKERYQSASDLQLDLIRVLYANYPDFSPKKLSEFMHEWFRDEARKPEKKKNKKKEEILASSKSNITHLVKKEDTKNQFLVDTVKPDDGISKDDFTSGEPEPTEKSGVTNREVTVEEMLDKKRRKSKINNLVSVAFLSVFAILLLIYVFFKFDFFNKKETDNNVKKDIVTDIKTEDKKPDDGNIILNPVELIRLGREPVSETGKAATQNVTPQPRTLIQKPTVKIKAPVVPQKVDVKKTKTPTKTETKTSEPKITTKQSDTNVSTYGKLRVDSNPRGASVKINGVGRGITPLVVGDLPKHQSLSVVVTKKDYQTWSGSVTLVKDKTEIKANLVR